MPAADTAFKPPVIPDMSGGSDYTFGVACMMSGSFKDTLESMMGPKCNTRPWLDVAHVTGTCKAQG